MKYCLRTNTDFGGFFILNNMEVENLSKLCPNCGKKIIFSDKYALKNSVAKNSMCKTCVCVVRNTTGEISKRENNSMWKGYKDIPYSWFSNYFERGSKKRQGFITIQDVYELWINQDKKCKLSGLDIGFYGDGKTHTCSIDRIDSAKEYTLDNIQLVHKHINLMKNHFNQDYFLEICEKITNNKIR